MERLQAFWRARIVDCKLSVISDPDDWPNRKSEIIERWRRGSERREENPWHQVNTAVAMKIIPCASTLPTLQTPRKARIISYLSRFPFWHFMSICQSAEPAHSFSPPGMRRQGSSENWDWRSQARPILQNLIVSRGEWCVWPSLRGQIAREA